MQTQPPTIAGPRGTYHVLEELGHGGFGVTLKARRESDGLEVVVKRLRLDRVGDWKAVELFQREARVLSQLAHPNIPRYLDDLALGPADAPEAYVIVQELVRGRTLAELRKAGPLDERAMLRWFLTMLDVCAYLHDLQPPVIHRDISPKNIMIREDGEAMLIDFGTVQASVRSESTISSTSAGTFGYAPMEQFIGRASPSSDLYGLGMTYIAVATGSEPEHLPFNGNQLDVRAALAPVSTDARLILALDQMIRANPEERPRSVAEVKARLKPLIEAFRGPVVTEVRAEPTEGGAAPSEDLARPWREARDRLARLAAAGQPPLAPLEVPSFESYPCIPPLSPDGRWLYIPFSRGSLVDLTTGESFALPGDGVDYVTGGFTPDSQGLVLCGRVDWKGTLIKITGLGGAMRREDLLCEGVLELLTDEHRLAVSPDGELALVTSGRDESGDTPNAAVVDLRSGAVLHRFNAPVHVQGLFSPDGHHMFCSGESRSKLFARDGGAQGCPLYAVAFSADGRIMAGIERANEHASVKVGTFESLEPLRWKEVRQISVAKRKDDASFRGCALSPDGATLALWIEHRNRAKDNWSHELRLYDANTGAELHAVVTPWAYVQGFYRYQNHLLGFAHGGATLLFQASFPPVPGTDDYDYALLSWDVRQARLRAALFMGRGNNVTLPSGMRVPLRRGKKNKPNPPMTTLGMRTLLGLDTAGLLDPVEQERLDDLQARFAFFTARFGAAAIAPGDIDALVTATAGLTHLLPHLMHAAHEQEQSGPRFGKARADKPGALSVGTLVAAATQLAARPDAERDVLFDEMIDRLEAEERDRIARELEADLAEQARRDDKAGRAAESAQAFAASPEAATPKPARRRKRKAKPASDTWVLVAIYVAVLVGLVVVAGVVIVLLQ